MISGIFIERPRFAFVIAIRVTIAGALALLSALLSLLWFNRIL